MLNDEILNAEEAAKVLHIGRNAVYRLAKSGDLPSYKIGRKVLFSLKDLQAYLEASRVSNEKIALFAPASGIGGVGQTSTSAAQSASFVIAGHGISADLFVDRLQMLGATARRTPTNSYNGLVKLYSGDVQAALVHLYDQRTNNYNIPYVQRLLPGISVIVFRLVRRWQGFAVAKGNPKAISSWDALLRGDIRLANRRRGCGSLVLMDEKLLAMGADSSVITGYETCFDTGLAAADSVSRGLSDVTVVGEQVVAQIDGVDFVPMQHEWVDLVVSKEGKGRELCFAIRSFFADDAFRHEFDRVVIGDAERLGTIVYEC